MGYITNSLRGLYGAEPRKPAKEDISIAALLAGRGDMTHATKAAA